MEALFSAAGLRKVDSNHHRFATDPESRELVLPEGTILFTGEEISVFFRIFIVLDSNESGEIQVDQGTTFLQRSKLPIDVLREIWRWASGGSSKPRLGVGDWFVALKLVALAQRREEVHKTRAVSQGKDPDISGIKLIESRDALFQGLAILPLPDFYFIPQDRGGIDLSVDASPTLPADVCKVEVGNPIVVGSGFSKYVQYTVRTKTTLQFFYNNQNMEVKRRYSDFVWLYERLKRSYPATAIPPLPSKKVIGNLDPKFIDERRHGLEQFLMHLIRHPKLGHVFDLQVLLDATANGLSEYRTLTLKAEAASGASMMELKASDAARAAKNAVQSRATIASNWLFPANSNESSETSGTSDYRERSESNGYNKEHQEAQFEEAKRRLARWNRKLNMYEVALRELACSLSRVIKCNGRGCKEMSQLSAQLMKVARHEAAHIRKLKSIPQNQHEVHQNDQQEENTVDGKVLEQYQYIEQSGSQLSIVATSRQESVEFHASEILSPLKFMVGQVKAMRKVLFAYKSKVGELRHAHEERLAKQKLYNASMAGAAYADPIKVEHAEKRVAKSQERIEKLGLELREMASSIELEVEKFERDRLQELQRIAVEFVKARIREADEQVELFHNLAKSTRLPDDQSGRTESLDSPVQGFRMKDFYECRTALQLSMSQKFKRALDLKSSGAPLQPKFSESSGREV